LASSGDKKAPLDAHAEWTPPGNRTDPVETLVAQGRERIPEPLPVRYARMKADPFAFLRGAAAVMAADLAAISTRHCQGRSSGASNSSPLAWSSPDALRQCLIAIAAEPLAQGQPP
jgi:hypothetical protein